MFLWANKMNKLTVNILNKSYTNFGPPVLGAIYFKVKSKQFISILGPSGCGKSTLLRMIAGLDLNFQGEIRQDVQKTGLVFQEPRLLPWFNVRKNIEFGLDSKYLSISELHQLEHLLDLLNLKDFFGSLPKQLSGGMAQKVSLARALISKPNLLLLDEPFASIDKLAKFGLQNELHQVVKQEGVTTLMVTHDIEEAIYLSDQIIILSNRPAQIIEIIKIEIPRPRKRTSPEFIKYYTKIAKVLGLSLD